MMPLTSDDIVKLYDVRGEKALQVGHVDGISPHLNAPYLAAYGLLRAPEPGSRLLDLGCGTGRHTAQFAKQGWRVTALDLSPKSIEAAKQHAGSQGVLQRCEFVEGSVEEFAAGGAAPFDVVFLSGVYYYLSEEARNLIRVKLLKPDGRLVFVETLGDNLLLNLYRRLRSLIKGDRDETTLNRLLRLHEVQKLGREFGEARLQGFDFFTLLGGAFGPLGPVYHRVAAALDFVLLNRLGLQRLSFKILFVGRNPLKT
jgi:SAM-dependent methyltransferase